MSEATDAVVGGNSRSPASRRTSTPSSSDAEALSFNAADGAGDAYSYAYTGKHDDGELPTLREGGHHAHLARACSKPRRVPPGGRAPRGARPVITRARPRARAWHRRRATAHDGAHAQRGGGACRVGVQATASPGRACRRDVGRSRELRAMTAAGGFKRAISHHRNSDFRRARHKPAIPHERTSPRGARSGPTLRLAVARCNPRNRR